MGYAWRTWTFLMFGIDIFRTWKYVYIVQPFNFLLRGDLYLMGDFLSWCSAQTFFVEVRLLEYLFYNIYI